MLAYFLQNLYNWNVVPSQLWERENFFLFFGDAYTSFSKIFRTLREKQNSYEVFTPLFEYSGYSPLFYVDA